MERLLANWLWIRVVAGKARNLIDAGANFEGGNVQAVWA